MTDPHPDAPHPDAPHPDAPPDWVLRCPVCGRETEHTDRNLFQTMWAGWPRCCGADKVLLPAADPPAVVIEDRGPGGSRERPDEREPRPEANGAGRSPGAERK